MVSRHWLGGATETMAFKTDIKKKEIRIQKQAQSLTAFQTKVAHGLDDRAALVKRLMAAAGAVLLTLVAIVAWSIARDRRVRQHETALAAVLAEVQGHRSSPLGTDEQLPRMRTALPRLEELARTAPGPCAPVARGLLTTWRLELGEEAGAPGGTAAPKDPWSRIRLAQRSVALGRAQEALSLVSPLHKKAGPSEAWSGQYWTLLMQIRQLEADREQALRDYSEYRRLFRGHQDAKALDKLLEGV
jgi:hypothetical protein